MNEDLKLREACHHLLWVWYQFAGSTELGDKYLDCHCMGAPEGAGEFLDALGYVEYGDWYHRITQKGLDLMEEDY
jgi:hypothetical protein